ncbi:dihydrodipicolinate synthase family protein [Crossiella sp. CA-258035]|uniref:dihydrodipicolinate synthase family protein n=1 Tax=Crossiella sp. CA-258035 TaxID=2981138 RepID=UPI0024BCD088|nr:dihydrodipicolinate synthase family protein [Crossiella sp. CA-258035]WHT22063.1 dihydrodipicolinate synthase family protein [Crossiella sp. CA-258035]
MTEVLLPQPDGTLRRHALDTGGWRWSRPARAATSRQVLAAAHVVADPFADNTPGAPAALDWDSTLAYRHHLWRHGLGVAEAMDTAQRGMGLDWPAAAELIRRSAKEARACGGRIAAGVGTDQLTGPATLDQVADAYLAQLAVAAEAEVQPILMCSRALAAAARSAEDYHRVYDRVLGQTDRPVILHWLGPAFDPALTGYWGSAEVAEATGHFLDLIHAHRSRVDGIKVSLLDAGHEIGLRRRLPEGVRCYTGDDYHYPELIAGDEQGHSDALLGILDGIAPIAADSLSLLDSGDTAGFRAQLATTVPLSSHLFATPTYHYKTGLTFLAWLTGHQPAFAMVGGAQSARSLPHLAEVLRLADRTGLLPDPELAAHRWTALLATAGGL